MKARNQKKSPPTKNRKYGIRFKVERLPPKARALVFSGLARGESYRVLAKQLQQLGYDITPWALFRFRKKAWKNEHHRLQRARANLEVLKEALQLDPQSTSARIAEEILYTAVCDRLFEARAPNPLALLREAREQQKVSGKTAGDSRRLARLSPTEQAREVRRRWRQLYGLEHPDGETQPENQDD